MHICGREIRITGQFVRTAKLDADKYQFLSDPVPLIEGLRKCGEHIDLFTFMQPVTETSPKYNYPMEWDNMAVLPITSFDNWWNKQLGFKARNKAKQAEKRGVVIREVPFDEALARGIHEIYNETPVRQGRKFPHYGKDTATVFREAATYLSNSVFIGAYSGDELIGFIKLVSDETGEQAGLMNIISKIQHRDKAPTNALVAHAVRSCADRGIRNLVYSNFSYGKRDRDSVTDFKERNGFARVDVPRYYVALSAMGWAAFRMGFHHRFADRVPESLMARLRELRRNWYGRRFRAISDLS